MRALADTSRPRLRRAALRVLRAVEPARRRLHGTLSAEELRAALLDLGVAPGATVMVHSSMDEVRAAAPSVDPVTLIRLLQELLTEDGTLLVPTFPFDGFELPYVREHRTFDRRRTPSRMGLMTEIFRRTPGTTRSLHPTHPVAGWGRHAEELLARHHEGRTYGGTSPFLLLREHDGLVVGIGVGLRALTVMHCAEELHPLARAYAFTEEAVPMIVTDGDRTFVYDLHPNRTDLGRDHRSIERSLRRAGVLRYERRRGLLLAVARVDRFVDHCVGLVGDGTFYRSEEFDRVRSAR